MTAPVPVPVLDRRRAGALLHLTSLPGEGGDGDLGAGARRFIDFLAEAGLSVWQMLPLGPTHDDGSPYHLLSAHAGNPLLISLERLEQSGWFDAGDPGAAAGSGGDLHRHRLERARAGFEARAGSAERQALADFAAAEAYWLEDYALYDALRREQRCLPWTEWPTPLRDRHPSALDAARARLAGPLVQARFEQYVFYCQWTDLRSYGAERGVRLFGDLPIFLAHDSAEVWAHRDHFLLDRMGHPVVVAGVPPDYFSRDGQRWGNPLYDWQRMHLDGFRWWIERLRTELSRFDLIRVDHFRGFEACWQIPAHEQTAVNGRWERVPGEALFDVLLAHFGALPLVAEDLGYITPEVHALRRKYGLPGMCVLQFAFDSDARNPYLPHNHEPNAVVYTGTHDNDTTIAWFEGLAPERQLGVVDYLGYGGESMPWPMIRAAFMSVARLAILPMQDILMLGRGNRMNTPGTVSGNWRWRLDWAQLTGDTIARLARLTRLYGRAAPDA